MDSRMFATPRPRPQFANSSALGGLDFDHKQISSTTAATPSTSGSKSTSTSTPSMASMISAASGFGADQSYFDEISNMIDSSHLETPQTCRIGGGAAAAAAASHLLRIPKQQPGVGGAGCSALRGAVGGASCPTDGKMLLAKEQHSGVKESSHQPGATHSTGVMGGGSAMMGIFSSPKSFVCTLSSSRSTSAPYTPTVVDECSPPCSLPAPPGSDPFAIPSFGSDSRSADSISGDFSAPLLNYLNDGLNSDSWGSFIPYTKITDYCFDNSPDSGNNLNGCGTGNISKHLHGFGNPTATTPTPTPTSSSPNTASTTGATIATSSSSSSSSSITTSSGINHNKWTGSILPKPSNCCNITTTPGPGGKNSSSASQMIPLKANELLDFLLLEIVKDGGHTSQVFEQASQVLYSATNLLAARFNKELPSPSPQHHLHHLFLLTGGNNGHNLHHHHHQQQQQQQLPPVIPNSHMNGNWSPNTLGVGGPNFAAPTMLAHPDEFKNPSSFLKIYGDPLCGKQPSNTAPTTSSTNPISTSSASSLHENLTGGNSGAGFPNANPMKGQNGNWACSKCSNVNFPRRFRCFKCGEYRDEAGDKIVSEYAKHVYLHHLKAYKSLGNNNNNSGGGGNGGRSGTGAMNNSSSGLGDGLRPVYIKRSNSNSSGFSSASSSSLNYTDSVGGNGPKALNGNLEGINNNSSSTNSSTAVSPLRSDSATSYQATRKSSKAALTTTNNN